MPVLGITGGIGMGKSSFAALLLRSRPEAELFDADACARELAASDAAVRRRIRAEFGDACFSPSGELDRARLRELVFGRDDRRRALEAILHPVIRERWSARAEQLRAQNRWLFVDIPLLFETSAESLLDAVTVVACSRATQLRRLTEARHLPLATAEKIVAAQMPISMKIERAGHVIWNDGSAAALEAQTTLFNEYLTACHG